MRKAFIRALDYYLPGDILSNDDLAKEFGEDWDSQKIENKVGIRNRHICAENETALDLAQQSVLRLIDKQGIERDSIDGLFVCTQSPDYFLPPNACILQNRLQLSQSCAAFDFNLGCSGYIYGLAMAKSFIEAGLLSKILLVTAESYSKFINPKDKSVRTIFGDAAATTLIETVNANQDCIGPFVLGTDGSGAENLIVPTGGQRTPHSEKSSIETKDESGNIRSQDNLFMNGPEIFNFTIAVIPKVIDSLLTKAQMTYDDIQWVVFHQANKYMLKYLKSKMKIPDEKFVMNMLNLGNTVSATIPIALKDMLRDGRIKTGDNIMLAGYGVGYSWGATIIKWKGDLNEGI